MRQDRERLGAVNLRAEEELTAIETQRESLTAERDDLTEAIKRLRSAIGNLNREGRERLLAAFTEVQGHFERLFTSLFGGGTAQLELVESDDPLEAGLEIVARPPGKKPQTMTLLSGGEQALTAIALIFAVFLTNPAPICVLDEVDAPLDDAMSSATATCCATWPAAPTRASWSSPTTPSPWPAWTACSASPWPSAASASSSRWTSNRPSGSSKPCDGADPAAPLIASGAMQTRGLALAATPPYARPPGRRVAALLAMTVR